MLSRAYSVVDVKSVDEEQRIIEGVASTPAADRVGDILEPQGAQFKLPLPLLWQHRADTPIGRVVSTSVTDAGIKIRAQIEKGITPEIDKAWNLIRTGLVRGLSVGFRGLDVEPIDPKQPWGGQRFKSWELLELSAVTIAANSEASITLIKSIDQADLASTPHLAGMSTNTPHLAGPPVVKATARTGARSMQTHTEQKTALVSERASRVAALNALMPKDGNVLEAPQQEEFDNLEKQIDAIDGHLARLERLEKINRAAAVEVKATDPETAAASRGGASPVNIQLRSPVPAGIGLARFVMASITARKMGSTVPHIARAMWPSDDRLHAYAEKAAVPAATHLDTNWLGNLTDPTNLESEFIEYLRPQTLVDRIPGINRVPFNVRVTGQTTGSVAGWVGVGKAKPVTSFSTTAITLGIAKIAAISVITQELARLATPNAETLVRNELARAVIERLDIDFIDPAQAAVANVNPASITNGLTAMTSAGTSADNVRTDLMNILEAFILQNMNANNVVLLMPNTLALAASLLTNAFGQPEFPSIGINGGSLRGVPVITSQYLANQSGAGNLVVALDPSQIFMADDQTVSIDSSQEASIEMSDAPAHTSAVPTGASLVSMYQTNSVAIRVERKVNWAKARATAVVYMDDVNWGAIGSPS